MTDELFPEFIAVPRHGECIVDSVLQNAGYVEQITSPAQADVLYWTYKCSPWCAGRVFLKDGRKYMFDRWRAGKHYDDGYAEPDAVVIRDVTRLLEGI